MATKTREEKIKKVIAGRQHGLAVVLEDIHDPHNIQAIVRTSDAFGIQDVYIIFEHEEYFNPRRVGKASSSSANKWVDFHIFRSTKDCLRELKKNHFAIIATVADPGSMSLMESKLTQNQLAVLVGNEHRGLSQTAIEMSDSTITIPMLGMVQSLNVSVAAATVLYEVIRQRAKQPERYKNPKSKQAALLADFLLKK